MFIFGTSLKANEVSTAIYRDFLPAALAEGSYLAAPEPSVVGHSFGDVQHALDIQRRGVSAQKIVVSLSPSDVDADTHTGAGACACACA